METIRIKGYAKINLALDVLQKREDGYHDVKMIMQTVDICDEITLSRTVNKGIRIQTNAGDIPIDENNLIYKAAKLLLNEKEEGIRIYLKKEIPVAAGMAGGSTDAAATLIGINLLFSLGKTEKELMDIGVTIGADVPYCILGGTALSEGIGEVLTTLKAPPECHLLIVKPDINVSTKDVYENLRVNKLEKHPDIEAMILDMEKGDIDAMCSKMENVLETVTVDKYPIITQIKESMKEHGAVNALMSGSGPTVFGIFKDKESVQKAHDLIKENPHVKQIFITKFTDAKDR